MTKASSLWSPVEINFLISNFDALSTAELSVELKRSLGSIRVQACRLGLSARHGQEPIFSRQRLELARLAFIKDPCMVTPSSRVGEYWPTYNIH